MAADLDFAKRLGRLKSGDSRSKTVGARLSIAEERELIDAANQSGRNVSEWCREVLLTEARKAGDSEPDSAFTEIVATRILLNNVLSRMACGELMTPQSFQAELDSVRAAKHGAARELKRQYAATGRQQ